MPTTSPMRGGRKPRDRARRLRANPTEAENRLWFALRPLRQTHGLHFRRQSPIGPYTVDFAFLSRKLIVEVDGGQHAEGEDETRDAWLKGQGYKVMRFWNNEIIENVEGVVETIFRACGAPHPNDRRHVPSPSAQTGRGLRDSDAISSPLPASGVERSASRPSGVGPPKAEASSATSPKAHRK